MNHNCLYNAQSLALSNEQSRRSERAFTYAHVCLRLQCFYTLMTMKVCPLEMANAWLWAGWGLTGRFPLSHKALLVFVVGFSWK